MPEKYPPARFYYWPADGGPITRIPYVSTMAGPYWIEQSGPGGLRGFIGYRRGAVETAAARHLAAEAAAARAMSARCLESAERLEKQAAALVETRNRRGAAATARYKAGRYDASRYAAR